MAPASEACTKLTVEYHGARFAGWAAQPGRLTVESELQRALETVVRCPLKLVVAGRTDAGVHASGQVVSYRGPTPRLRSVNALLSNDVAVLSAEEMPSGFSARYSAKSRRYVYKVYTRTAPSPFLQELAVWYPYPIDLDRLEACADALVGTHDFTAFTPTQNHHKTFMRTVHEARWYQLSDGLNFHIEADSFLRHMNRVLIGTMFEVARGSRTFENFTELLGGRPRSAAGVTAPAHGLYLVSVRY